MRKILALIFSICLITCLASCKNSHGTPIASNDTAATSSTPVTSEDDISTSENNTSVSINTSTNSIASSSTDISSDPASSDNSVLTESITSTDGSHTHSYSGKITKNATCTESGVKTFTCSCGASYTEKLAATGHKWSEWETIKQPTSSTEGNAQRKCSACNLTESKSIAKLPTTASVVVTKEQLQQIKEGFLKLVNAERNRVGAASLTTNDHLEQCANIRSSEVIDTWSHTRPNGESFYSIIDTNVYPYIACGENLCMTSHKGNDYFSEADKWTGSPEQIEAAYSWIYSCFKNSPGHYQNMINTDFENCGIGISYSMKHSDILPMFYVAHIFGTK